MQITQYCCEGLTERSASHCSCLRYGVLASYDIFKLSSYELLPTDRSSASKYQMLIGEKRG
ncbi:unnamed protein product [Acanthoscelides obtectus]|uniref:Uncharacterized protein n=1 Tax=Acanthoscelides obtectus TaxID=200917 RepID=A0A9P0K233_ACAOB|nr:unnamed protein product [Acanthoscelides obtectus]CAK1660344.1 hypothetical protein AOBTE_LOCUS22006 [Acanthoscelides obtectus]